MSYSSDYLLSQLQVPYDGLSQAEIDQRAADARMIVSALNAGQYRTPNFAAAPISPNTFLPQNTAAETVSSITVNAAIQTGSLSQVHAAVDSLNRWRSIMGGVEYVPPAEIDILANSHQSVGALIKLLRSREPQPLILEDPKKSAEILAQSDAYQPKPQAPVVTSFSTAVDDGAPTNVPLPAADGSKWIKYGTPFGFVWVKVA